MKITDVEHRYFILLPNIIRLKDVVVDDLEILFVLLAKVRLLRTSLPHTVNLFSVSSEIARNV